MSKQKESQIKFGPTTKVEIAGDVVKARGAKGEMTVRLPNDVRVEVNEKDGFLKIYLASQDRAVFGLYRALIKNLIDGVTTGFKKDLEMVGIGYKVKKDGRDLVLTIGYSHPVRYSPPAGCELEVSEDLKISVVGISRELVGQVAAEIKKLKRPEPYKGKGIRYSGEVVKRKAGKAGKVGVAK